MWNKIKITGSSICELILNIYGFYQNTSDVFVMKNKRFEKSTTYKFLILCGIFNIINYLLKIIIMTWLLIDLKDESCYYFAIFTEFSSMWSLFGISALRFISIVKKIFFYKGWPIRKYSLEIHVPNFFSCCINTYVYNIHKCNWGDTAGMEKLKVWEPKSTKEFCVSSQPLSLITEISQGKLIGLEVKAPGFFFPNLSKVKI